MVRFTDKAKENFKLKITNLLIYAINNNYIELVKLLLSGAHFSNKDKNGKSILEWAVEAGHLDILYLFLDHYGVKYKYIYNNYTTCDDLYIFI